MILGVYFSGTGNTKHCIEYFVNQYDSTGKSISIEHPNVIKEIASHDMIVFGYPVYFSNTPKIVSDFIKNNLTAFYGKEIFVMATMGLFSGDGTGCAARLFKKSQARIIGGIHLKMPDCIGDEKPLKKSLEENKKIIRKANDKIVQSVNFLKAGTPPKEGLGFFYHFAGLLGQRLWFYSKSTSYKQKPNINDQKCTGCEKCVELCPMRNIKAINGTAVSGNRCTLCYRCFAHCPAQALTILGKHVQEQCLFEKYQ